MSLLCFKNCRDSAMLLGMPTDQLMKKRVFNGEKEKQEKPDEPNFEKEEDPPYLPWDGKQSDATNDEKVDKILGTPVQSSSSSWGRIGSSLSSSESRSRETHDSDEFSHVNVYSKKVMGVVEEDHKLSRNKDEHGNAAEEKDSLFSKFGRSISSLLKRSDSKKVKDPEPEQSRANTINGYEAGESASETLSTLSEARFWSIPYSERQSDELPTNQSYRESSLDESNFSSMDTSFTEYRRSSLDSGYVYMAGQQENVRSNQWRGYPSIESGTDEVDTPGIRSNASGRYGSRSSDVPIGVDTPDGMRRNGRPTGGMDGRLRRKNKSFTNIPSNGSVVEVSPRRPWSMMASSTSPRRRGVSSADQNERQYASTGNLTDYSYSSADPNMRRSGSFTRYKLSDPVTWSNSSSRVESFTSTPRRSKGNEGNIRAHDSETVPKKTIIPAPSKKVLGIRNTPRHHNDLSGVTLNLDLDYKADSSRLYVILKSMHGLTPTDRTTAKTTNVRVHLVVMPERLQRAYTRRKSEGWTVRFMEKFRFSDINTLNSIAFKVILNDGSAKERLIGTKAIHMKEWITLKGKQSLTIEINQYNFDTHDVVGL